MGYIYVMLCYAIINSMVFIKYNEIFVYFTPPNTPRLHKLRFKLSFNFTKFEIFFFLCTSFHFYFYL